MQMPRISRSRALLCLAVVLLLLVLGGRTLLSGQGRTTGTATDPDHPALVVDAARVDAEPSREVVVHVVGAVRAPARAVALAASTVSARAAASLTCSSALVALEQMRRSRASTSPPRSQTASRFSSRPDPRRRRSENRRRRRLAEGSPVR